MIYLDCVSYHAPAARSVIKTVGPGPMIFATDAPPLDVLKERYIALIEKTDLPAKTRKIFASETPKNCRKWIRNQIHATHSSRNRHANAHP